MMARNVVRFPPPTPVPPLTAAERQRLLFEWADRLLEQWGIAKAIARATLAELGAVRLDEVAVMLAIREALHPAQGQRERHFENVGKAGLKLIIKNRFEDRIKDRKKELRRLGGAPGGGNQPKPNWTDDLILDDDGEPIPNLANVILILSKHPRWEGVLAYDEFGAGVVIRKQPPWKEKESLPDAPWTDHHESLTTVWFQHEDLTPNHGVVGRGVQAAARHNQFHPVRDYFDSLVWDGVSRLDAWLVTYFHAEDTPYIRAVGPRYMISAPARIYKPGCKVDHMLVFEGPQGKQKSTALDALASPWFTDRISNVGSKDACIETSGVLLVEIPEMDALTRASSSAQKSFLTRRHDRYRPPYGKHPIKQRRQCVFAGTINPPVGGYLKDPTGARRFWPVACQGVIDRDGIERDRDQLWAEAVVRFKAGAPWHLETPELEALATVEQAARFVADAWKEPIEKWLGNRKDVSITEVLAGALTLAAEDWTQSAQNRVPAILTSMGFTRVRTRKGNERPNRYRREKS
jgi:putative DNA primase/helicase